MLGSLRGGSPADLSFSTALSLSLSLIDERVVGTVVKIYWIQRIYEFARWMLINVTVHYVDTVNKNRSCTLDASEAWPANWC